MAEKKNNDNLPAKLDFNELMPKKCSLDALARKIIKEKDTKNLFALLDEFKTVTLKKELVRLVKLGEFADMTDDEIGKRLQEHPERLKNSELVEFSELIQNSMDRANKQIDSIRENEGVSIQANTVNVTKNELKVDMSTASREKIANVVMSILNSKNIEHDKPTEIKADEVVITTDNGEDKPIKLKEDED